MRTVSPDTDLERIASTLGCSTDDAADRVSMLLIDMNASRYLIDERSAFEALAVSRGEALDQHARLSEPIAFESTDRYGWNGYWTEWDE